MQVSVDEDKDEKSDHIIELEQTNQNSAPTMNNNTEHVTSPSEDVNMNVDVNLEERDLKIEGRIQIYYFLIK